MRYTYLIVVGLLMAMTLPAMAASSYLGGMSGVILTPDDQIVPQGTWEGSFHDTILGRGSSDFTATGLTYGLLPNLEIGASYLTAGINQFAWNGKYRVLQETPSMPSLTVGVFDAAGNVAFNGDASFYALISKHLTTGQKSPVRLGVGAGSGFYDGVFANMDWALMPRLSLLAEYKGGNGGFQGNRPSVGLRWAATNDLSIDAASVGFRDLGFGLSYRAKFH